MIKLGVNIDHIATLRNARKTYEPEPIYGAGIAELAGADSIVSHLREDRRHINDRDVEILRKVITTRFNLEMSTNDEIVNIAIKIKPDQATLVPERREEVTTEGGLDVIKFFNKIKDVVKELQKNGIEVSLFIDPDKKQIEKAKETNANIIEIHTGEYSNLFRKNKYQDELNKIKDCAKFAKSIGLIVSAGHGLTYQNVGLIAAIPEIEELNIGHSIISRAIFVGLGKAVAEMKEIMLKSRGEIVWLE